MVLYKGGRVLVKVFSENIPELNQMETYPEKLFYIGDKELLKKRKISIVGSRRPISYTKNHTFEIANKLSKAGVCIVSGAAMGVDALAHKGAGAKNTIAVMGNGLNMRYPAVNRSLIKNIEQEGLCISQFEAGEKTAPWTFVMRNEIVVALGEVLVVTQADISSGSMRSVEFALKMGKKIYVLPHRIGDSEGTNHLLSEKLAEPIYDIDDFISLFADIKNINIKERDELLLFCKKKPTLNECIEKFGEKVYEYELEGKIVVKNMRVFCA